MSTKETQEQLVANLDKWQKIELAAVSSTDRVIKETQNPIISLVMEIIQRDSQMHHRVQEVIKESLTKSAISLSPDELGQVWNLIEKHIAIEKQTVELAQACLQATGKNKGMLVQNYLLEYLLKDEEKHDAILDKLGNIKKGMYPYA